MTAAKKIIKGYTGIIQSSGKALLTSFKIVFFLIFVLALSFVIVYPLWFLAKKSPDMYSFIVLITTLSLFLIFFIIKAINNIKIMGLSETVKSKILPIIKKIFIYFTFIFLILLTIYLFTFKILLGSIAIIAILLIFGYAKFVYKI